MYRRRRLVVLLVLLAVVAAVVLAVWQPWRGWAATETGGSPAPTGSTRPVASPTPTPTETDAETEADAPEPEPSASDPAIASCTTSDISVQAVTDKDAYGSGELPQLSIMLSNTSDGACLMNVGTATQSFVITSGSDTWWRSTDCQTESSDQVVQLAPGQTVSSVTPLAWDRTRSSVDTCDASRPQAPAGYFHLQVSIGGIQAADTKMFQLR